MSQIYLITGATGFVGSHLAEACRAKGYHVRALVRQGSDASFLERLGVDIYRGELSDAKVVSQALVDVDVVVHCAAKVGDWGKLEDFRVVNVEGTRHLLEGCKGRRSLARFVQLSSLGVYEARHHYGTDESEPLPPHHEDAYAQTKVEAEQLALRYYREAEVPVVVLRPGFVYGPRDHTVLPRIIEALRARRLAYFSGGRRALNTIYVGSLVDAIFLAVAKPNAIGQVYNLTDGEFVSKRKYIESVADGMGLPRPGRSIPFWLALLAANIIEGRARRRGAMEAPLLTRARIKFLGLNLDYSIAKAQRELEYRPRVTFEQGIQETMAWYRQNA